MIARIKERFNGATKWILTIVTTLISTAIIAVVGSLIGLIVAVGSLKSAIDTMERDHADLKGRLTRIFKKESDDSIRLDERLDKMEKKIK